MENQNRTIWRWLADWFAVRAPNRLVVDGVFLLFWAGVVHVVWTIWWSAQDESVRFNQSAIQKTIALMHSSVHSGLFYLGIVFIAVGCARLIGRSTPPGNDPQPPTPPAT